MWLWTTQIGGLQNPNLLVRDDQLIAIDHELTFSWFGSIGSSGPTWVPQILQRLTTGRDRHVFADSATKWAKVSLSAFRDRLLQTSDREIDDLTAEIPSAWLRGEGRAFLIQVREYLIDVRNRINVIVDLVDARRTQ